MLNDLTVDPIKITLGIGQIVHRIQDVGFAYAVGPSEGVDPIAKFEGPLAVILEVEQL